MLNMVKEQPGHHTDLPGAGQRASNKVPSAGQGVVTGGPVPVLSTSSFGKLAEEETPIKTLSTSHQPTGIAGYMKLTLSFRKLRKITLCTGV